MQTSVERRRYGADSFAAYPEPRVIYAEAQQLRRTRDRQTKYYVEGTAAVEFAASVLNEHSKCIRSFSRWWAKGLPSQFDYFTLLGNAICAQEFFLGERRQFINFNECCRLLRTDRETVWVEIWKGIDPAAWCWLVGIRAVEMLEQEPADEPESLGFPEWQPLEDDEAPCVPSCMKRRLRAIPERDNP